MPKPIYMIFSASDSGRPSYLHFSSCVTGLKLRADAELKTGGHAAVHDGYEKNHDLPVISF